jgi:hypothetical protein
MTGAAFLAMMGAALLATMGAAAVLVTLCMAAEIDRICRSSYNSSPVNGADPT